MSDRTTKLTDALVARIESRLVWRGAKVAAAEYAGISRQNLGKFFRERGVGRDSEVLLRLDEFSRWPVARQKAFAGVAEEAAPMVRQAGKTEPVGIPPADGSGENGLPAWLL